MFGIFAERVAPSRLALAVLLVPVGGIIVLAISRTAAASSWLAVAMLGIGQGTSTLLRPLVLSRRLNPLAYGRGAAQSAAWSTVSRAVAPLLLAVAAGLGATGYPVGFTVAAAIGIAGAVVAYRSLRSRHRLQHLCSPATTTDKEPHPHAAHEARRRRTTAGDPPSSGPGRDVTDCSLIRICLNHD